MKMPFVTLPMMLQALGNKGLAWDSWAARIWQVDLSRTAQFTARNKARSLHSPAQIHENHTPQAPFKSSNCIHVHHIPSCPILLDTRFLLVDLGGLLMFDIKVFWCNSPLPYIILVKPVFRWQKVFFVKNFWCS